MAKAAELRERFRALPKDQIAEHQDYAIRVWRSLSWLERAESAGTDDPEGRFIFAWIGFNALYARVDDDHRPWGDREALGAFLAQAWRLDRRGRIRRLLGKRQLPVLKLIENKYLSSRFWDHGESAAGHVRKELQQAMARCGTPNMLPVLQVLFERLYTMRNQVMHGASTKGSRLNRRTLHGSGSILLELLPEVLEILIDDGIREDWGRVCYRPDQPAART